MATQKKNRSPVVLRLSPSKQMKATTCRILCIEWHLCVCVCNAGTPSALRNVRVEGYQVTILVVVDIKTCMHNLMVCCQSCLTISSDTQKPYFHFNLFTLTPSLCTIIWFLLHTLSLMLMFFKHLFVCGLTMIQGNKNSQLYELFF